MHSRDEIRGVDDTSPQTSSPGPFVVLAGCWIAGVLAGRCPVAAWQWLALASVPAILMLLMVSRRRMTSARHWALITVVAVSAAWSVARTRQVGVDDIRQYITPEPQLVQITGTVASAPALSDSRRGAFGGFCFRPPGTLFTLDTDSIVVDDAARPIHGRLLVKIDEVAHRLLRPGDVVRVTGWLAPVSGPANPGEFDYRASMARRNISGRIALATRGNCRRIDVVRTRPLTVVRRTIAEAAANSLRIGMEPSSRRVSLLDAILLGRRHGELADVQESFRRVGLAHLLSISGAHLAILLWVVWLTTRLFVHHPARAALIVLLVLGLYMLVVPPRVPIVRAGIMASLFCIGYATGRRVRPMELLGLACLIVLIWRPGDLFGAGFQLSFGVVAGLMLFTGPLSECILRKPEVAPSGDRTRHMLLRRAADYLAVNVVAFAVAMPLVAFHFQVITPLTILLAIMALPVIVVVLALGYLKILIGFALPSTGVILAGPLSWAADIMWSLVEHAATWPAATIELARPPSAWWAAAALSMVVAWLAGWFVRRRVVMVTAIAICSVWLIWLVTPAQARPFFRPTPPAMRVNMFAVGDGTCCLVRFWGPENEHRYTLMYDCGSMAYPDVGLTSINPSLRALGVRRIDTLVISHANLDHYGGSLDVIDSVPVGRVLVSPQLIAEARSPESPPPLSFLLASLSDRQVSVEVAYQGFRETHAGAAIEVLWPPRDLAGAATNDTSLVMSVHAGGLRLLLNGDIQDLAIGAMLDSEIDLSADVSDLPHHGGFVDASARWLNRVRPEIVLQSSSVRRLQADRWQMHLDDAAVSRFATARSGMIELDFNRDSTISVRRFKQTQSVGR